MSEYHEIYRVMDMQKEFNLIKVLTSECRINQTDATRYSLFPVKT